MPRKLTLSDLDFSNDKNSPDWVLALREENARDSLEKKDREENRAREAEAKAAAIVQDYQSRGINLSDDKIAEIYNTVARTGQYVEPSAVPAAPVLPSSEPAQDEGYWADRMNELRRAGTMAEEVGHGLLGSGQGTVASLLETGMKLTQMRSMYGLDPSPDPDRGVRGFANDLRNEQDENYAELGKFRDYANTLTGVDKKIAVGIADAAQSAGSSLPSLFGGAFGLTAVNDVYAQTYRQAVRSGVESADAERLALEQAAPELIGVIPAGKFGMSILKRLPIIGPRIESMTKEAASGLIKKIASPNVRAATDIARTAVGEMAEENITGTLQDFVSAYEAGSAKGKEVRDFAKQQAPLKDNGEIDWEQFLENRSRERWAAGAMALPAGVVEARNSGRDYETERKSLEDELTSGITSNLEGEKTRQDNINLKADVEANQDRTLEEQRAANEQAKQQAFDQAEKDAAQQKELEQEAGFQTIQRDEGLPTSRVERYAGVVERVPVNPAREVTAENVAEQRAADERAKAAADKAEADRVERVRQGKLAEEVRKERERMAKQEQKELQGKTKAEQKIIAEQRGSVRRQLIKDNPEASDLEIGQMLDERMKTMPAPVIPTDPIEKKAASALKGIETARKRVASTAETKRMNALARKNPEATPQELAALFNGTATPKTSPVAPQAPAAQTGTTPAAQSPNATPEEQERNQALEAMGISLGMANKADSAQNTPAEHTQEGFQPAARKIANALTKRMDTKGRALSTLIKQGKVVIAPSAKYLNRQEGRAAEYDPETGKTYIYADQVDANNIVPHLLEAASHEAGHAGTRNQRNGRADLMRTLLGKDGVSQAEGKIRLAARKGNKLAQNAVRLAEADTAARNGDNQYEGEEVVSYFTGEAVANRDKPLGTVAGVARDIRSKTRSFLRDKMGLNIDVDLSDLDTAAQNVLQETADTDLRATGGDPLGMIYNKSSKGYAKAVKNGWVYDSVDGNKKYVLSDEEAKLKDGAKVKLRDTSNPVKLGEVLDHEILYKEHPKAKDITVYAVEEIPGTPNAFAMYDPNDKSIWVTRRAINNTDPSTTQLKEALMHEIQHYVQDMGGYLDAEQYADDPVIADIKEDYRTANNNVKKAARRVLDTVPVALRDKLVTKYDKELLSDIVFDRDIDDTVKAAQLSEFVSDTGVDLGEHGAGGWLNNYRAHVKLRSDKVKAYNDALQTAHEDYLSNITEREAFRTQGDTALSEEDVRARGNPEGQMMFQSGAEFPNTAGRLDVPSKADSRKGARRSAGEAEARERREASARELEETYKRLGITPRRGRDSLGMAAKETNTPTATFREWFGNSVAVNEDGSPKRYYSGTSKDKDFRAFNIPKNGAWFTDDPDEASMYARDNDSRNLVRDDSPGKSPWALKEVNTSDRVFPVYLRAENPYTLTPEDRAAMDKPGYKRAQAALFSRLKAEGYDSVIWDPEMSTIAIIGDATQIKSVLNENPTNRSKDVLGMASRTPAQVRRSSAVVDFLVPERFEAEGQKARMILTGLFSNAKGLNKNILTAYEHAQASPAAEEAKANRSLGKYEAALQRLAVERKTTPEALNKKIMEELDAIDATSNSRDVNLAAFTNAVSKYGDAGKHLLDLRNQVDGLTLEMLKQRAKGPKPGPEEAKLLATLAANMGRYSHRLYAAHQGKAGKLYAHSVLAAYRKGQKGKDLTPRQQESYDMVQRAVKTIIDDGLVIPDDGGLAEADNERIARLYHTWGDGTARDADEMRDQLADLRDSINTDTDRLQTQAESILKELLDIAITPVTSPIATYYRGAKQDRGILQERKKIPAEIRAVMGEVTDPATRLLATVAKQAEFVARTKFLLEVQEFAKPEDLQPPGSAGTPTVTANNMSQLKGESYGPLNGWYASPNLQAMLGDVRETLATFEQIVTTTSDAGGLAKATVTGALNKWMGLAALSKRLQIVGNLFLLPLNFLGSFGSLAVNGNIKPTTMARGLQDAVALIRYARNPSLGLGSADDAVHYGVTDSATVGELKGLPYQKIQAFANEMAGKKVNQMWAVAKRQGMAFTELYAMMDVWAKIANFHNEVSQLQSYYKKNNQTRTEEEIKREAADIVNSTNITYKRAAPIVKALERGAITNFGTYFYETFRSQLGNTRQGIKEMTVDAANASTPAAKAEKVWRGTKRLSGQAAFWTAASMITSYLSSIMFGNDDDEWDKRSIFPDYMQNQDLYTVGVDEKGNPIQFAVSRIDAYGPMTDIMRQVQAGGMSYDQAKEELLSLYVRPRMGPQLWKAATTIFGDDRPTKDPLIKELMPNGYENILKATSALGVEDKTTRALANLVESVFVPGTLNAQRSTNPKIAGPVPARERASDLEKALQGATAQVAMATRVMGATFVKADPARVASFAKMDYDNVVSNARKDFAELFDDRPNVSDTTIVDAIVRANDAEHKEWNKLARIYRGMQATGMSPEEVNKVLKEAKINGDLLRQIRKQEFSPTAVSKKSFDGLMQRELRSKTNDEKKEIKARWKAAWERLEQAQESIE